MSVLIRLLLDDVPVVVLLTIVGLWKVHRDFVYQLVEVRQTSNLREFLRPIAQLHVGVLVLAPPRSDHFMALVFVPDDLMSLDDLPASHADVLRGGGVVIVVQVPYK